MVDFENTKNLIIVLCYRSHWIVSTNIQNGKSSSIISNKNAPVFVYDSFGNSDNLNALQLTLNHMFEKLDDFVVHQVVTFYKQVSVNDCGLFALAYVWALYLNFEPSLINFCQDTMNRISLFLTIAKYLR